MPFENCIEPRVRIDAGGGTAAVRVGAGEQLPGRLRGGSSEGRGGCGLHRAGETAAVCEVAGLRVHTGEARFAKAGPDAVDEVVVARLAAAGVAVEEQLQVFGMPNNNFSAAGVNVFFNCCAGFSNCQDLSGLHPGTAPPRPPEIHQRASGREL